MENVFGFENSKTIFKNVKKKNKQAKGKCAGLCAVLSRFSHV